MESGSSSYVVSSTNFGKNTTDAYYLLASPNVNQGNLQVNGNLEVNGSSQFVGGLVSNANIASLGQVSAQSGAVTLQIAGANLLPSIVFTKPGGVAAIGYDAPNNNLLIGFGSNPDVGILGGLNVAGPTRFKVAGSMDTTISPPASDNAYPVTTNAAQLIVPLTVSTYGYTCRLSNDAWGYNYFATVQYADAPTQPMPNITWFLRDRTPVDPAHRDLEIVVYFPTAFDAGPNVELAFMITLLTG